MTVLRPRCCFNVLTDKLSVRNHLRVKFDLESLCMPRPSRADQTVIGVLRVLVTSGIPDCSLQDALIFSYGVVLEENVLYAPEAARGERRQLCGSCAGQVINAVQPQQ
jgi:hypothetical protein